MYKREFFHDDVLRRELFMALSPLADDIWFWAMIILNDIKIKLPVGAQRKLIYTDVEREMHGETLWRKNQTENNVQLGKIIEKYPALLEKLIRETVTFKPYISVIMPIKNDDMVLECLKNIFLQNFPDFELIFINLGSRKDFQPLPANFQVINYPNGELLDALNIGLQKATGEYILFKDEDSLLLKNSLEVIAQIAEDSKADVIHFAGHLQFNGEKIILDDALNFEEAIPILFDEPRQNRALFWLQDKLSGRLDTKIFKKDFLIKHDINFDNDLADFLFKALIQAEKYLIVPQAFCSCKEQ